MKYYLIYINIIDYIQTYNRLIQKIIYNRLFIHYISFNRCTLIYSYNTYISIYNTYIFISAWEEEDGILWTNKHHSINTNVAAYFPPLGRIHICALYNYLM